MKITDIDTKKYQNLWKIDENLIKIGQNPDSGRKITPKWTISQIFENDEGAAVFFSKI